MKDKLSLSVIIPTYRRSNELFRCLEALRRQNRLADEIIVVVRDTDRETVEAINSYNLAGLPLKTALVKEPGQIAALNSGLEEAKGGIIAFVDDDAEPASSWLELMERHFLSNDKIGGVGGRDRIHQGDYILPAEKNIAGKIWWFGRIVGNHHAGRGPAREVHHLKGANMGFRREAIEGLKFDTRLRGSGAQCRNDMAFCLAVKRRGWKLIYDPQVLIEHYYATRYEEDQRNQMNLIAVENGAHNEMLIFLDYLPLGKKISCIFFSLFVGTLFTPGLVQFLRILLVKKREAWLRFRAALKGRWMGFKTWQNTA